MKILISVDMEGIEGICEEEFRDETSEKYFHCCTLMTQEINEVINLLLEGNHHEITIVDAHGSGKNIIPELLDKRVQLIQSKPGKYGMLDGIEEKDFLLLAGYHGMANKAQSYCAHTNLSKIIRRVSIGSIEVGEIGINLFVAQKFGAKTIFVSGTDYCVKEVFELNETIPTLITKKSSSMYKAKLVDDVKEARAKAIRFAINNLDKIRNTIIPKDCSFEVEVMQAYLLEDILASEKIIVQQDKVLIKGNDIIENFIIYRDVLRQVRKKYRLIHQ